MLNPKLFSAKIHRIYRGQYARNFAKVDFYANELDTSSLLPGQFFTIAIADSGIILRRPFSVFNAQPGGYFSILLEVIGRGTKWLANRQAGDELNLLGPLGNGYLPEACFKEVILVGGGIGAAPLYFFAKKFRDLQTPVSLIMGSCDYESQPCWNDNGLEPSVQRSFLIKEYRQLGCETLLVLENKDGDCQLEGMATELLEQESKRKLELIRKEELLVIACGPKPMLRELAHITNSMQIKTKLLMEEMMGCGIGVCLSCVCKVQNEGKIENRKVCTDGPVFDAEEVVFG